jgi:hypothetical protein
MIVIKLLLLLSSKMHKANFYEGENG